MSRTLTHILHRRRFRKLLAILVIVTLLIVLVIVPVESQAPNGKIKTHFDALWWATSTISTVGYGDYIPVTIPGRMLGMILQLCGSLMFGVSIALFSISLNRIHDEHHWNRTQERFDRMEKLLNELEKHTSFLVRSDQKKK